MEVNVIIEAGITSHLNVTWVQEVTTRILTSCGVCPHAELGIFISSQERVQQLNKHYFGLDSATDVITFPFLSKQLKEESFIQPPDGFLHLGEIIISYAQAYMQAREQGHSLKKEITILIIHGVLHLLGYEDEEHELEQEMRVREEEILNKVGGEGS